MSDQAKKNRAAVARHEQKKRDAGLVQRKRWAHPDDWPIIDEFIRSLNANPPDKERNHDRT